MQTLTTYRAVWAEYPLLAVYAAVVVVVFALAVVGTFIGGPLAVLFIPALAGAFVHHLLVMKRAG